MERERVSEQQTMTDEYIKNIAGTRRIMSNVLNILSQQERTMRTIVTNEQRRQTRNNATNQIELDDFVRLLSPSKCETCVFKTKLMFFEFSIWFLYFLANLTFEY